MSGKQVLKVGIGNGSTIDGGPFYQVRVIDGDGEVVDICTDEGETEVWRVEDIQEAVSGEMDSGEPVHLEVVSEEEAVAWVRVPIGQGMSFEIGARNGAVYTSDELRGDTDLIYAVQEDMKTHGGYISPE